MVQIFSMGAPQPTEATVRALSSLTRRDADAVRATVRAAASCHTVQEHDDYDGFLSLLIAPEDDVSPSFMVAGRTGAVEIAVLWEDEMQPLGIFPSIGAAMIVLRPELEQAGNAGTAFTNRKRQWPASLLCFEGDGDGERR